jgi:hypothetical protein
MFKLNQHPLMSFLLNYILKTYKFFKNLLPEDRIYVFSVKKNTSIYQIIQDLKDKVKTTKCLILDYVIILNPDSEFVIYLNLCSPNGNYPDLFTDYRCHNNEVGIDKFAQIVSVFRLISIIAAPGNQNSFNVQISSPIMKLQLRHHYEKKMGKH